MAKKTLLELMVEAGVKWPDGAEYAAQDGSHDVNFYRNGKPNYSSGDGDWNAHECEWMIGFEVHLQSLCRNWHQTIVTREQYEAAVADKVSEDDTYNTEPESCESGTRSIQASSIEQRIAELRAMEKQAAEFRAKLTDDLHALGITWLDGEAVADESNQPVITDWRDLKVGDEIKICRFIGESMEPERTKELLDADSCTVVNTEPLRVEVTGKRPSIDGFGWELNGHQKAEWRFMRRP